MTFFDLLKKFPTEKAIIDHYIIVRYGDNVCCNHCNSAKVYRKHTEHKNFRCADCNNSFSVFKDTIFEDSSTDLIKWMFAIHLFLNGKKGISGCQLQREIGVTYKTAWRMLQQIRIAMGNEAMKEIKKLRPSLPVIALSAFAMESDKARALGLGFDAYLTKPLDRKLMFQLIEKFSKKDE